MMKKLLIALTLSVYFVPATVFLAIFMDSENLGSMAYPITMMLIVCALVSANIVGAIIFAIRSKCLSFKVIMVFKLCLIPFYIVNFVCWGIASMVFHIALVIWPMIPFIIIYTYFTILGTSSHNIAHLLRLCRNKKISIAQCIIHCGWQFIFVADIVDSIYLAAKQKKIEAMPEQLA